MNGRTEPLRSLALAAALLVLAPSTAAAQLSAQNQAIAEQLFQQGLRLMEEKAFALACPKFEESDRLVPDQMGTRFQLADCYEHTGRLASAWALFVNVSNIAKLMGKEIHQRAARERADEIEHLLPKLTLSVPPVVAALPGFELRDNGTKVERPAWGEPIPVDPGKHRIRATARGRRPWESMLDMKADGSKTVVVGALEAIPMPRPSMAATHVGGAIAIGSVGVTGVVLGGVFAARAASSWSAAASYCEAGNLSVCDLALANPHKEEAVTNRSISIVGFVIGGVALAGSALLWLWPSPPSKAPATRAGVRLVPTAGPDGAGFFVQGVF
jgi:hypothetical protein